MDIDTMQIDPDIIDYERDPDDYNSDIYYEDTDWQDDPENRIDTETIEGIMRLARNVLANIGSGMPDETDALAASLMFGFLDKRKKRGEDPLSMEQQLYLVAAIEEVTRLSPRRYVDSKRWETNWQLRNRKVEAEETEETEETNRLRQRTSAHLSSMNEAHPGEYKIVKAMAMHWVLRAEDFLFRIYGKSLASDSDHSPPHSASDVGTADHVEARQFLQAAVHLFESDVCPIAESQPTITRDSGDLAIVAETYINLAYVSDPSRNRALFVKALSYLERALQAGDLLSPPLGAFLLKYGPLVDQTE